VIAYLEISGRMSGKTTRLLGHARRLAAAGKPVAFVTQVYKHLPPFPGITFLGFGSSDRRVPDDAVWMFDEFDFNKRATLRAGGYYATTPSRLRDLAVDSPATDLLLALIEANGGLYMRAVPNVDLTGHRQEYPPADYRLLITGEFLS
jgi:hypothetical protein